MSPLSIKNSKMKHKRFKYCPFCRGDEIELEVTQHVHLGWVAIAKCSHCMAQGSDCGYKTSKKEAIDQATKNWNAVHRTGGWVYEGVEIWCDTILAILSGISRVPHVVKKNIPKKKTIKERFRQLKHMMNGMYQVIFNGLKSIYIVVKYKIVRVIKNEHSINKCRR